MLRPSLNEYNPYFGKYIDLVGEGDFFSLLGNSSTQTVRLFGQLPLEKHNHRYAEDKWSVKEVLMHIIDTERVMAYRALVVARGDNALPLNNMDQDIYARHADVSGRGMESLIQEFSAVRNATSMLFEHLSDEQAASVGKVTTHSITPRALGYIIIAMRSITSMY